MPAVVHHIADATNGDLAALIIAAARDPANAVPWPRRMPVDDAPRIVWELLRSFTYVADGDLQTVQGVRVLFMTRRGDCKSYAVAAASLLRSAGWSVAVRFVAHKPGGPLAHVYVIATRAGRSVVVDGTWPTFGEETAGTDPITITV